MPLGVSIHAAMPGTPPFIGERRALITTRAVAASRTMMVPAPSATMSTRNTLAVLSAYVRRMEGAIKGTRAAPDFIATIPCRPATAATPRLRMAVVCAMRQTVSATMKSARTAALTPASGHFRPMPALAPTRSAAASATAATIPRLVGRRCVLIRRSTLSAACSSTSARTSSQAHRPTSTLTSRSLDQPVSISIMRTARALRSASVSWPRNRSALVQVSLQ